jgi:hypothetical protein
MSPLMSMKHPLKNKVKCPLNKYHKEIDLSMSLA